MGEDSGGKAQWAEIEKRVKEILEKREKREAETGRLFHQQLIFAFGTMGAIAFAGLVLIVEDQTPFQSDFGTLVFLLSMASILAACSSIASIFGGAGYIKPLSPLGFFGYATGVLSFVCFLVAVVFVAIDVDASVGDAVGLIVIALLVLALIAMAKTPFGKPLIDEINEGLSASDASSDKSQ